MVSSHKRLAIYCLVWGVAQIAVAYSLRGSHLIGYFVCLMCWLITITIMISLSIIRRNLPVATISTRFYIAVRRSVFIAFVVCFVLPAIYGLVAIDRFHLAIVFILSVSAFCSIVLASNLYGKSMSEFLERNRHKKSEAPR